MVSPSNVPKPVFPPCSKRIHFAICGLPREGSVIGSRRHFLIVAATSAPAIMHCIMGCHGQCMSWRDDAGSTANIVDRAAPYPREAGRGQDAVASPPMRCPADAVFLASAMKLRAAKNNETQVKAIAS